MRRTDIFTESLFTMRGVEDCVLTKYRNRLIEHDAVIEPFNQVLAMAIKNDSPSGEHFNVDGTLIQAWAGHKNFARKDGADDEAGNFKNKSCCNGIHESTTNTRSEC